MQVCHQSASNAVTQTFQACTAGWAPADKEEWASVTPHQSQPFRTLRQVSFAAVELQRRVSSLTALGRNLWVPSQACRLSPAYWNHVRCWQLCLKLKGSAPHDTRTFRAQLPSPLTHCLAPARQVLANAARGRISRDRCLVRLTEVVPSDAAELCQRDDNDDGGDEVAGAQPGGAI